ncbi:MAG: hypothetical protein AB7F86_10535 [Bdellovibrionales bacterium]
MEIETTREHGSKSDKMLPNGCLYSDQFLDVMDDHILLKGYYFLKFGQRRIELKDVQDIKEVRLVYFNGLTRHEQVWLTPRYPFDWKVKNRKEGILLTLKGKFWKIGISAENPTEVALILMKKIHLSN